MVLRFVVFVFFSFVSAAHSATASNGSRDEAVAMAHSAKQFYVDNGFDALIQAVHDKTNSDFHDRDLYVFVVRFDNVVIANGGNPKLAGRDVSGIRDHNGFDFSGAMIDLARTEGQGWVDYIWPHPLTKKVAQKSGYVLKIRDDMYVGVGIYKPN